MTTATQHVQFIDDNLSIVDDLERQSPEQGIKDASYFTNLSRAFKSLKENHCAIISVDYELNTEVINNVVIKNGIDYLKFLKSYFPDLFIQGLIYTGEIGNISKPEIKWCQENKVQILEKPKSHFHYQLFETIKKLTNELDLNKMNTSLEDIKFTNMTEKEVLLFIVKDLIAELEQNKNDYFDFGNGPVTNEDVLIEIHTMTAIGKEIIVNWFEGVKSHLDYLHRNSLGI